MLNYSCAESYEGELSIALWEYILGRFVPVRRTGDTFCKEVKGELRPEGMLRINWAKAAGKRDKQMQKCSAEKGPGAFEEGKAYSAGWSEA